MSIWGLGHIVAPAATDRMALESAFNAGGYSERGEFMYRDSTGRFIARGGGVNGVGLFDVTYATTGDSTTALRTTLNGGAGGLYVSGYSAEANFSHGSEFVAGSNWVARQTNSARYSQSNGAHSWFGNTGLTAGSSFTPTLRLNLDIAGNLTPGADNAQALGGPSSRWSVGYAGSNWVITCDVRFKTYRAESGPTAAELRAALRCADEMGFFQSNDAIELKGPEGARWHFGPRAQGLWTIFADEGLCDALIQREPGGDLLPPEGSIPPAFLCFDEWGEETAQVMAWWRPSAILGPDGEPVMVPCEEGEEGTEQRPTGETYVTRPAGNRFGVRIDQLHSLMIAALNAERLKQEATIADLVARVIALEPAP